MGLQDQTLLAEGAIVHRGRFSPGHLFGRRRISLFTSVMVETSMHSFQGVLALQNREVLCSSRIGNDWPCQACSHSIQQLRALTGSMISSASASISPGFGTSVRRIAADKYDLIYRAEAV